MEDDTHTGTVASVRSGYESILIQNIGHVCVVVMRLDYVLLKIKELRLDPEWYSVFLVEEQGIFRLVNDTLNPFQTPDITGTS